MFLEVYCRGGPYNTSNNDLVQSLTKYLKMQLKMKLQSKCKYIVKTSDANTLWLKIEQKILAAVSGTPQPHSR